MTESRPAAALRDRGIEGQHGYAKAVPEASLDLSALELERSGE
jgi:hypothetical protein